MPRETHDDRVEAVGANASDELMADEAARLAPMKRTGDFIVLR